MYTELSVFLCLAVTQRGILIMGVYYKKVKSVE